jgi:hypothetical protein
MDAVSSKPRKNSPDRVTSRRLLYQPFDWLLIRAPLLPIEFYLGLRHPDSAGNSLGASNLDAAKLKDLTADPRIQTALAVASPSLCDALSRADSSAKSDPKTAAKLLRYLIRMSTRPTPYGLLGGVALARWGSETDLALAGGRPRTQTRPT